MARSDGSATTMLAEPAAVPPRRHLVPAGPSSSIISREGTVRLEMGLRDMIGLI